MESEDAREGAIAFAEKRAPGLAGPLTVAAEDDIRALLVEHDRLWSELDLDALSALWDIEDPNALYMGDEYRDPVVGEEFLRRHWARLGSRLQGAEMASDPVVIDPLSDRLVLIVDDRPNRGSPASRTAGGTTGARGSAPCCAGRTPGGGS